MTGFLWLFLNFPLNLSIYFLIIPFKIEICLCFKIETNCAGFLRFSRTFLSFLFRSFWVNYYGFLAISFIIFILKVFKIVHIHLKRSISIRIYLTFISFLTFFLFYLFNFTLFILFLLESEIFLTRNNQVILFRFRLRNQHLIFFFLSLSLFFF